MNANDTIRGEAYHTGYEAHQRGEARTANPYPSDTWDADEWLAGWDDAAETADEVAE